MNPQNQIPRFKRKNSKSMIQIPQQKVKLNAENIYNMTQYMT